MEYIAGNRYIEKFLDPSSMAQGIEDGEAREVRQTYFGDSKQVVWGALTHIEISTPFEAMLLSSRPYTT